ncbi:MAG TPA: hypothetical protein VNH18_14545 [Bryobacteraceae bacterium]|nr:hypothetical protein [Bryobacteraceae bacterium]
MQVRVGETHLFGTGLGHRNVHEFALADARAPLAGFAPGFSALDQFRPEGKRPALERFHRVNAAAIGVQKLALRMAGYAQAAQLFSPKQVLFFEGLRSHAKVSGDTQVVLFSQVDEALFLAAFSAAMLALEP